jgi:hypothetical protein
VSLTRRIFNLYRFLFRQERLERELDEEFRSYLEIAIDENIRQGLSRKEA